MMYGKRPNEGDRNESQAQPTPGGLAVAFRLNRQLTDELEGPRCSAPRTSPALRLKKPPAAPKPATKRPWTIWLKPRS